MQNDQQVKNKVLEFGGRAMLVFSETKPEALTPAITTDIQSMLAGYAAVLEEEYARYEMAEPIFKSRFVDTSEAERNREWQASPDGQRQIELKYKLKSIDRIIAACKRRMERFVNEAKNLY